MSSEDLISDGEPMARLRCSRLLVFSKIIKSPPSLSQMVQAYDLVCSSFETLHGLALACAIHWICLQPTHPWIQFLRMLGVMVSLPADCSWDTFNS